MHRILSVAFALFLSLSTFSTFVRAQEGTTCDSTLMLLVLLARVHYGYESSFELNNFEFAQLQPLFDQVSSDQSDTSAEGSDASAQSEQSGAGDQEGDDPDSQAAVESGTSAGGDVSLDLSGGSLPSGNREGEPTACAQLRTEVEIFLLSHLQNTSLASTPEPTAEPDQ